MAPTVNIQAIEMTVRVDLSPLEEATRDQAELRQKHQEHLSLHFRLPERKKLFKTTGSNLHLETFKSKHTDS